MSDVEHLLHALASVYPHRTEASIAAWIDEDARQRRDIEARHERLRRRAHQLAKEIHDE